MASSVQPPVPAIPTAVCTRCDDSTFPKPTEGCPAGTTGSPVLLNAGSLYFEIPLLSTTAIGSGSFGFTLSYVVSPVGTTSMDGTVGVNFNYSQNAMLAPSGSDVKLWQGENTQEVFTSLGGSGYSSSGNNTASILTRTGSGTAADQFTLVSGSGTVSHFAGFFNSITTPGRLLSLTDRFGNMQSFTWGLIGGLVRLLSVTDSYGRTSTYSYYGSTGNYLLQNITDFLGRQASFQYDSAGRLIAAVGPSITRGANNNANTFPNGTGYVFQYDTGNSRPARQNDLVKIWNPNQVAPYISSSRIVDFASVYAHAAPRQNISYYNDPTDTYHYGKIQQLIESSSGGGSVGAGAYGYMYLNSGLPTNRINPSDAIVSRAIETDRNGNQVVYDFNVNQMLVHKQVFATRGKSSLEASSWETWTSYNTHNQPLTIVMPEGNSIVYTYEDETNTISFGGVPYARRFGLMKSMTRLPGNTIGIPSRPGSNGQTQLQELYFYDPIFNNRCATIEARGNPIDASNDFFPPQNLGTTPTLADRSRYAAITYYDYQKDAVANVQADTTLQSQLGLTSTQIGQLITFVSQQMNMPTNQGPLPAGFQMGIGDVNGEGTGAGTGVNATHIGNVVKVQYPSVRQLVPNTGGGDPWIWQTQSIVALFTSNLLGERTTMTDPEGNLTVYVRYPQNDPEGAGQYLVPSLSNKQYGFLKEVIVDADPATVMSLVGSDGDMLAFTGNIIPRTNTPGVYQNLTTSYQGGGSGCSSCAYDALGNPLSMTDARGNTTSYDRNELGQIYRTTSPAPYNYQVEKSYDANRNVIQLDTQDVVVQYSSDDPSDPTYGQFFPTGSGSTANLPTQPGPGGAVRPGWFSNLYNFDLIDNKIQDDIDATGSSPTSLVTTYAYDFNQNLITITKPLGNTVDYDYDERNLQIATRVGYTSASPTTASVTIVAYDGNGNAVDVIGPAIRGTAAQSLSCIIGDAFNGSTSQTFTGDWVAQNTYDGFDRLITSTDAVGGTVLKTFDPGGRTIANQALGTSGGSTPVDRSGSRNVLLASASARYDEAGRSYEGQQDVFLDSGGYGSGSGSAGHALPSGRTVTHTGGGLAANATANNHTNTVTLTAGGVSYVLTRRVFDRASRTSLNAADNTAIATAIYDGANRQLTVTDPLGNNVTNTYDGNGNVIGTVRAETCTISASITREQFATVTQYDVLNREIVTAEQGPDGAMNAVLNNCCAQPTVANLTLFTLFGFDSRGNRTNAIDPKQNTVVSTFDGASRQLQTLQNLRTGGSGSKGIYDTVTTLQQYDANSNLLRLVDDNGGVTTWTYDNHDRQTSTAFHDGSTRTNFYNLANNIVIYSDENGSQSTSRFDVLGRRTGVDIMRATNVVGTTSQTFQYDGLQRGTFSRDIASTSTNDCIFILDSVSRILEEAQVSTAFGAAPRYVTKHKWLSFVPLGFTFPNTRQIANTYDALYRRQSIAETVGAASIANWQFFGPNRLAIEVLGNGITCSYMNNAQTASAIQSGGPYPPAWGDKTTDRLGYDGSGRMTAKRFLPASSTISLVGFTTQYDASSDKLYERALHAESRSALYASYDSMDRLLQYQRGALASGGGSIATPITLPGTNNQQSYNLDGLGNWRNTTITPEGGIAAVQNRTHNKLNELTQFASTPVLYDHGNNTGANAGRGNGNIVDDGARVYAYDALNRLTSVNRKSTGLQIAAYNYDATGRRVGKITMNGGITGNLPNGSTFYVFDGSQIVEQLNANGSTVAQFIWGTYIDELVQIKSYVNVGAQPLAPGVYYPLQDLLYRTSALTGADGTIVEAYDTDAYGNTLIYSNAGTDGVWFSNDDVLTSNPACNYIFTGQIYDPETQIYSMRLRTYVPSAGRFTSRDPATYLDSFNLYGYVYGNPTIATDPHGLARNCIVADRTSRVNLPSTTVFATPVFPGVMFSVRDAFVLDYAMQVRDCDICCPNGMPGKQHSLSVFVRGTMQVRVTLGGDYSFSSEGNSFSLWYGVQGQGNISLALSGSNVADDCGAGHSDTEFCEPLSVQVLIRGGGEIRLQTMWWSFTAGAQVYASAQVSGRLCIPFSGGSLGMPKFQYQGATGTLGWRACIGICISGEKIFNLS